MRRIATALAALATAGLAGAPLPAIARPTPATPDSPVVLVLDHGSVYQRLDPIDPSYRLAPLPPAGRPVPAGVRGARLASRTRASFASELDRLFASGAIDQGTHERDRQALLDARRSLGRLSGTRRDELGAVLANLERIAGARMLTPSRLPGLMAALTRNREWWTSGPLLSDGQRVGFRGSELVWQYYTGQGIEIQWLGTFGKANGYFLGGRTHDAQLTALLDEAGGLATQRAGGIAWEYDFRFDGGAPPWVSGLAQGTAVQALARAAVRFSRAEYFAAARSALGVFETPPPEGVRVPTPAGAHYLIYSFAPHERVLNGFIQSLVGLHDYAALANNDAGRALFAAGEAQARLEVPRYDTGAWSLYDQSTESDLGYHMLLRDFLSHLCERLGASTATARAAPLRPERTPAPSPSGGTAPTPSDAPPPTTGPSPSAAVYCAAAEHFTAYTHQPPTVSIRALGHARAGHQARVRLALSKISLVRLSARRGPSTVYRTTQQVGHGPRTLLWRPRVPGGYRLSVTATDLAGNTAAAAASVTVAPAGKHR